jgi:hypothetical protein
MTSPPIYTSPVRSPAPDRDQQPTAPSATNERSPNELWSQLSMGPIAPPRTPDPIASNPTESPEMMPVVADASPQPERSGPAPLAIEQRADLLEHSVGLSGTNRLLDVAKVQSVFTRCASSRTATIIERPFLASTIQHREPPRTQRPTSLWMKWTSQRRSQRSNSRKNSHPSRSTAGSTPDKGRGRSYATTAFLRRYPAVSLRALGASHAEETDDQRPRAAATHRGPGGAHGCRTSPGRRSRGPISPAVRLAAFAGRRHCRRTASERRNSHRRARDERRTDTLLEGKEARPPATSTTGRPRTAPRRCNSCSRQRINPT